MQRERMIEEFLALVRIDSQSRSERLVADRLVPALRELGCDVRIDDAGAAVGADVGNVIARMPATAPDAPPVLLSAHMDTVPPGNGVKPVRMPDRIKTDGTTVLGGDDKSGIAVIMEVLRTLKEREIRHGEIDIVFSICEEIGLLGAKHLDAKAFRSKQAVVLDSPHATLCVTQAPSADRFEFTVHGLAAHAGVAPETGISAVRVAAQAIAAMPLGRIDAQTTSNVVIARGGEATNVVPDVCVIRGEARSLDDASLDRTTASIRRCFQEAAANATATAAGALHRAWVEERCEREYESMNVPASAPVVRALMAAAKAAGAELSTASIGGGSDANVFNRRGIEAANLGTGMRAIHTLDEWLDLEDFFRCADVVFEFVRSQAA